MTPTKMRTKKSIEELNLIEDFLFTEATVDEQTAPILMRLIVERATQLKIGELIIEPQKAVNGVDTDSHGIRLDVSVKEISENAGKIVRLFDVEPNNTRKVHLPKRSRFYQALIDVKLLETGMDYEQLPDMWSIWILPYDPFGMNRMVYTVKNVVEENSDMVYNDGVKKLFLYTKGKEGGTETLRNLLAYIENSSDENAVDDELKQLHSNVERLKHSAGIGVRYMQMWEVIKYKSEELGEEIGKEIAQELAQGMAQEMAQGMAQEMAQGMAQEMAQGMAQEMAQGMAQEMAQDMAQELAQEMAEERAKEMVDERIDEALEKSRRITKQLLEEGRYEDLRRFTEDAEYRKELLENVK